MSATLKLDLIVDDRGMVEIKRFSNAAQQEFGRLSSIMDSKLGAGLMSFSKSTASAISGLVSSVFSLQGAIAGLGIGYLGKQLISSFTETAAGFEQMRTSLDTLTQGHGDLWFRQLNEWALKMPINTQGAIKAFTMMRAMGLEPTLAQMTTLVDTVSALGGESDTLEGIARAIGQIATKGKVSTEELMQLAERGIPIFDILTKSFGKVDPSTIGAGDAINAIFAGLDERFGGQSKKMENTWKGMMEALKGYWEEFKRLVAEGGIWKELEKSMKGIVEFLDELKASGRMEAIAKQVSDFLVDNFKKLLGVVKDIKTYLEEWKEPLKDISTIVNGLIPLFQGALAIGAGVLGLPSALKSAFSGSSGGYVTDENGNDVWVGGESAPSSGSSSSAPAEGSSEYWQDYLKNSRAGNTINQYFNQQVSPADIANITAEQARNADRG